MNAPHPGPIGTFHVARADGAWTWSDGLYAIYGFGPGDVVPSAELVSRHLHPEDRLDVERLLGDALETGTPFSLWHRMVDAHGGVRHVVTLSAGDFDADHRLVGVSGQVVDLSEPLRLAASAEVDVAMEQISRSRPLIEQAKGALMLVYALDDAGAFEVLRRYSQQVNVKVRDVAASLVQAATTGGWPAEVRAALDGLVPDPEQTGSALADVLDAGENPGA